MKMFLIYNKNAVVPLLKQHICKCIANDHTFFNIVTNLYLNSFKYTVLLSWMHQLLNRSLDC